MAMKKYKSTDQHISTFPAPTKKLLKQLRATIKKAAPKATEKICYGIPTFYLNGNLVHFCGYDKHIGFYPGAYAIVKFKAALAKYETSRGTIKLPLDKPIPTGSSLRS